MGPDGLVDGLEAHLHGAVALGVDADLPPGLVALAHQRGELTG